MKVHIHTLDGDVVTVKNMTMDDVLELIEEMSKPEVQVLSFDMGDDAMTYIRREAIARVDFD